MHFVAGGISVQITCTGATSPGAKVENVETAGGVMDVLGAGKARYTGCAISNSAQAKEKCKVPTELQTVDLEGTTEGDKIVLKPKGGNNFIMIAFTSVEGKTCPAVITGETSLWRGQGNCREPDVARVQQRKRERKPKIGEIPAQLTVCDTYKTKGTETTVALETP